MSQRKDAVYSDRKVTVSTSWIGHDVGHVKKGYWILYRMPDDDTIHIARSLGTVDAMGEPHAPIKNWIVAAVMSITCDCAFERWIDPAWVIRSIPYPPARLMEFMMSDFSDTQAVIKRMEEGIPSGFNPYLCGEVPKPDPRWEPATLATSLAEYANRNDPVKVAITKEHGRPELVTVTSELNKQASMRGMKPAMGFPYGAQLGPEPVDSPVYQAAMKSLDEVGEAGMPDYKKVAQRQITDDEALLMEALDFGQFSKGMIGGDPGRGLVEPIRQALVRHLESLYKELYGPVDPTTVTDTDRVEFIYQSLQAPFIMELYSKEKWLSHIDAKILEVRGHAVA